MGKELTVVMDAQGIERCIERIAYEIRENNEGAQDLVIIGIRAGGILLADRLSTMLRDIEGTEIPTGVLDITLYRDDLLSGTGKPKLGKTEIPFSLDGKIVVLVDDVIFTGRTIRAAMDALIDFGRPKRIQLAVLIDRGHRELPISPDYVGKSLPSSLWEKVVVELSPSPGNDRIIIEN